MIWLGWALLLLLQNASFTWVSRARNSGSVAYNALASVFSNGIWFVGQVVVIDVLTRALRSNDMKLAIAAGLWYTTWTVIGSTSAQFILMKYIERGKRLVGAR